MELDTIKASDAFGPGSSPGGHTRKRLRETSRGAFLVSAALGRETVWFGKSLGDFLSRSEAPAGTPTLSKTRRFICVGFETFYCRLKFQIIRNYFNLRIHEIMFSVYGNFVVRNGRVALRLTKHIFSCMIITEIS